MKKIFWFFFFTVLIISACKKDEYIFNESPDQRVNAALTKYSDQLTGAQYGWKGFLTTSLGNKFDFFFTFDNINQVKMVCNFDSTTGAVPATSSYRIKALQQPSLIFDTYSYIHLPADPNPRVNGGDAGVGLASDFEFRFDSASTDTIKMKGTIRGSTMILVRATQAEMNAYFGGGLSAGFLFHYISAYSSINRGGVNSTLGINGKIFNYWKRFKVGANTYEVDEGTFDPFARNISFSSYSGTGVKTTFTTHYTFGLNKVVLDKAFDAGGTSIKELTNLVWDDATKALTVSINGTNTTTTFTGAIAPIFYDTTAFTAFRNRSITSNDYWISSNGFMRNGVFNSYGLDTLTANTTTGKYTYYNMIYYANYGTISGFRYDLVSPLFLNPAQTAINLIYGFAAVNNSPASPIVTNGIANFNFGGNVGTGTPTTGGWANTLTLLRGSAGGYYFVKLPDGSYDQVSVSDAKSWIPWFW